MVLPLPRIALRHFRPNSTRTCTRSFSLLHPFSPSYNVRPDFWTFCLTLQLNLEIPEYSIDEEGGIITVG